MFERSLPHTPDSPFMASTRDIVTKIDSLSQ
jgi:hypothetical protein